MRQLLSDLLLRSLYLANGVSISSPPPPLAPPTPAKIKQEQEQAKVLDKAPSSTDMGELRKTIEEDKVLLSPEKQSKVQKKLDEVDKLLAQGKKAEASKMLKDVAGDEAALLRLQADQDTTQWRARTFSEETTISKDDTLYSVAKTQLGKAGIDNPTPKQIHDYEKKIAAANPDKVKYKYKETYTDVNGKGTSTYELEPTKFPKPGEKLTLPPAP